MDKHALAVRLARKFGISEEDAALLVEAGLDEPAKVKDAKDKDIRAAVGKAVLKQIKGE